MTEKNPQDPIKPEEKSDIKKLMSDFFMKFFNDPKMIETTEKLLIINQAERMVRFYSFISMVRWTFIVAIYFLASHYLSTFTYLFFILFVTAVNVFVFDKTLYNMLEPMRKQLGEMVGETLKIGRILEKQEQEKLKSENKKD